MSRILFTTIPLAGHLRPGLPIAKALVGAGHEVAWYTTAEHAPLGNIMRARRGVYRQSSIARHTLNQQPRTDLVADGVHPSPGGRQKVAEMLLGFFKTDPLAATWFVKK